MSDQNPATEQKQLVLNPDNPREREIILRERDFAMVQRKAQALAAADIIPANFKNKVADCLIAMEMAERLKTGELEIMQNLYVVHGKPAFSSAYLIAQINRSGILRGRLKFVYVGTPGQDDHGCFAIGVDKDTGDELKGTTIDVAMAKAEGWWGKSGSKWPTMTEQMLAYRAAAFWSRIYAPDATMGMHTVEERVDIEERDITPQAEVLSSVNELLPGKADKPAEKLPSSEVIDHETGEVKQAESAPKQKPAEQGPVNFAVD